MRCQKVRDYISQEMDELLPPDVTGDLTSHLDSCSECRDYRVDLQMGRRAIAATTPELSDNFEWKLQLKLNQTLQQTAGQTAYPWEESDPDKWRWARNFGAAAAVGMAAVLALAMFLGPVGSPSGDGLTDTSSSSLAQTSNASAGRTDRLPLLNPSTPSRGLYSSGIQRSVSAGGTSRTGGTHFDRGWSGQDMEDLRTIQKLRFQNEQLTRRLILQQQQVQGMRALLDTNKINALNLERE